MKKKIILHADYRFYYMQDDKVYSKNMTVEEPWPSDCELNAMKRKLWLIATRDAIEYCNYNNVEFIRIETP